MARNWLTWASVSTALVSIGYGASYLAGLIYHQTYLLRLEVPSELFPKKSSDYFVFAYTAWVELATKLLPTLLGDLRPWILLAVLILICLCLGVFLGWASETKSANCIKEALKNNPKFILAGSLLFIPITTVAATIIVPVMLIVVTIVPVLIGNTGGSAAAIREGERFQAGCDAKVLKQRCYDLMDGEEFIARGFIVEVSDAYIALMTSKGPQILPLSGRSLKIYGKLNTSDERK